MLDDIIVWWHPGTPNVFDVMPNASNTERVIAAIGGDDITADRAVIAVQGPDAPALGGRRAPGARRCRSVPGGRSATSVGSDAVVAGTGYTGEPGIEIAVPADGAEHDSGTASPSVGRAAGRARRT